MTLVAKQSLWCDFSTLTSEKKKKACTRLSLHAGGLEALLIKRKVIHGCAEIYLRIEIKCEKITFFSKLPCIILFNLLFKNIYISCFKRWIFEIDIRTRSDTTVAKIRKNHFSLYKNFFSKNKISPQSLTPIGLTNFSTSRQAKHDRA